MIFTRPMSEAHSILEHAREMFYNLYASRSIVGDD